MDDNEFEFNVLRYVDGQEHTYVVQLPHQCDDWEIANTKDYAEALARMERFVAEAQAAERALREGRYHDVRVMRTWTFPSVAARALLRAMREAREDPDPSPPAP